MSDDPSRDRWNERYAGRQPVWSLEPTGLLVSALRDLPPGRALDLGAGEGRNAIWLAGLGWSVTAVDFSSVAIERGRRIAALAGRRLDWRCEGLQTFRVEPGSFDLIVWIYVHLPNKTRRETWLHLLPGMARGGHFVYIGHDPANIGRGAGGPQTAEVLASVPEVIADLPGFEVLEGRVIERPYDQDPGHGGQAQTTGLDTFVHARLPLENA